MYLKSAKIDAELTKLPELPTGNLPMKILEKIIEFESEIGRQIEGGSQEHSFQKVWHRRAMEFRGALAESHPNLIMSDLNPPSNTDADSEARFVSPMPMRPRHSPASRQNGPSAIISIDDDDDEEMVSSPSTSKRRHAASAQSTPRKKPTIAAKAMAQRPPIFEIPKFKAPPSTNYNHPFALQISLEEVRTILQDAHIGLPGQHDPRAINRIIRKSMQSWDQLLRKFMAQTEELCLDMIKSHIDTTFALWQKTRLHDKIHIVCEVFVKARMSLQTKAAERARLLELHKPVTFNKEAMEWAYAKGKSRVQQHRQRLRARDAVEQDMKDSNLSLQERIDKMIESKTLGPDEYAKEIQIMGVSSLSIKQINLQILMLISCRLCTDTTNTLCRDLWT